MKKGLILPVLALALFAGACEEDEEPFGPEDQVNVRFVNAIGGVNGNVLLTADGTVIGPALGFGAMATQCVRVDPGNTVLAFGMANAGGTAISGTAISTQTLDLDAGGNVTIVATGTATNPSFVTLNNRAFTGNVGANQAAIRFINLVPTLNGGTSTFNVFTGTGTGTQQATNLTFGNTSTFTTLPSGSTILSFRDAEGNTIFTNAGTGLNLQSGTINTVAILPTATGTSFQLVNITPCP